MKGTWNKLIRDEKGQALIIVLILLLLGGLIIAPLLGFMSTGLIAGQVFEEKMEGLYAADAGMENALWKLLNGETPACTLTDVNGMDVTVVEHVPYVETADGTLYTLQSTAELAGETKAEIVAQVMVTVGSVAEGGEGGEYDTNPDMGALSVIDKYIIIFTTHLPSAQFKGWGDDDYGAQFGQEDLWSLNIATGTGALYLDGEDVMANPKYKINGVHYYHDEVDGYDYLLMTIKTKAYVGAFEFNNNDIIRLQVDVSDDPVHPSIQSVTVDPDPLHTIIADDTNVDIVALSARGLGDDDPDNDIILFSFSNESATLGGNPFDRAEVIKFDGSTYTRLFDADDILPGNPNLVLDCLAIMPESDDLRLLLSFDVDPVEDSDGEPIKSQDIAVWDPADDTIILHISMSEDTFVPGSERTVSIVSWEIS